MKKFRLRWRRALTFPMMKTRYRVMWGGALLAMVLAEPALEHGRWLSHGSGKGFDGSKAAALLNAGSLPDPLVYLSQRSPGARGAGALLQTKNRAPVAGKVVRPHERVLANIRYASPGLATPALPNDILAFSPAPFDIALPAVIDRPPPAPGVGPTSILIYGGGFGGGSGGGGGGGGGKVTPPAVPEPATWAMLILGMFLTGRAMRSAQLRQAESRASGDFRKFDATPTQHSWL